MRCRYALLAALTLPAAHAQTFSDAGGLLPNTGLGTVGTSVADVDGDGRMDLLGTDVLLLQRDGGFEARFIEGAFSLGSVFGDVDGDGRPEALVLDTEAPNVYRYHPASEAFTPYPDGGIDVGGDFFLTQGSILFDYDRDGALDVLIGNDGGIDLLFRGLGGGTFENMSSLLPQINRGDYGMMAADYDRDGDDDVYVGLCFGVTENILYRNDGAVFPEMADAAGVDDPRASWGVFWLDFDNNGWQDLFVANMPDGSNPDGRNRLYRNEGDGTFTDVAASAGVAGPQGESTWNVTAADFDNDGWLDLFVANQPQTSRLYRNNGDSTFTDITASAGLADLRGIPVAAGDVNGDGWVDLFVPRSGAELFYNDGGTNGWLTLRLRGQASNPDGVGARVEVTAGSLRMVREITAGDGFMSQSHGLTAHFGLGAEIEANIAVYWPSGEVSLLTGVPANQHLTLVEGLGLNDPPEAFALTSPADGAAVPPGEAVTLQWEPAVDPEGAAVTYTVHLSGPATDTTFTTTASSLTLPADAVTPTGDYRWAVVARDAYSARTSLDPFRFTNGSVANEPEAPALRALTVGPNPAGASVTLRFDLAAPATLTLEAFDVLGRRVRHERLGLQAAGPQALPLAVGDLEAGVYVLRLSTDTGGSVTRRFTRLP